MDYKRLLEKKARYDCDKISISKETMESYTRAFDIEYSHTSTAIEGNTLSLIETKTVLEDNISIGGKYLREIYEVINHDKAFQYVKACILKGFRLDENIVKDINQMLVDRIMPGGIYRSVNVRISGAKHTPPSPSEMYTQIKYFYSDLNSKEFSNPIELAAWTHAEFVKIHPFIDGNGRTSRLLMNYQLMANGFLPILIEKENRLDYFIALESYATEGNLAPFADMVATLEEVQLDVYQTLMKK